MVTGASSQTGQQPQQPQLQQTYDHQTESNTKAITLLTVGISALFTFCASLVVYIRKNHARQLHMATRFVEATMAMNASTDKLAESIRSSGESISKAVAQQERTVNDLHKYILKSQR